ncbi:MAG: DUF7557 family protein [Candidatus Freyarchaeota archaeon]
MSENLTSIQLSKAVKEQLKKLGKEGETYDDIIRRLIRIAESHAEREKSQTDTPEVFETRDETKRVAEVENILRDIHKKFKGKFQDWKIIPCLDQNHPLYRDAVKHLASVSYSKDVYVPSAVLLECDLVMKNRGIPKKDRAALSKN